MSWAVLKFGTFSPAGLGAHKFKVCAWMVCTKIALHFLHLFVCLSVRSQLSCALKLRHYVTMPL